MQRYSALMAYEAHLRNSWKPDLGSSCLNNMNVYSVTHCSDSGEAMKQTTSTTTKNNNNKTNKQTKKTEVMGRSTCKD